MKEKVKDVKRLYLGASKMLDEDESGYKHKGYNNQGFPILDCKDRTHSIEFITFNIGEVKKK